MSENQNDPIQEFISHLYQLDQIGTPIATDPTTVECIQEIWKTAPKVQI